MNSFWKGLCIVSIILATIVLVILLLSGCTPLCKWEIIREGEVTKVQYIDGGFAADKTILRYQDGSTYVIFGYWDVDSKNTIVENCFIHTHNSRIRAKGN